MEFKKPTKKAPLVTEWRNVGMTLRLAKYLVQPLVVLCVIYTYIFRQRYEVARTPMPDEPLPGVSQATVSWAQDASGMAFASPKTIEGLATTIPTARPQKYKVDPLDPTMLHGSLNATRAVVAYLPPNNDVYVQEFRWWFTSWLIMMKFHPEHRRTDLLLIVNDSLPLGDALREVGCSQRLRKTPYEPSRCIWIDGYAPLRKRDPAFEYDLGDCMDTLLWQPFLDAIKHYDFFIRSDLDTFVTPAFATWWPAVFVVGGGGYGVKFSNHRLERVSVDLGLTYQNLINVGSTWYGNVNKMLECANLTLAVMRHLMEYEFTTLERSGKLGVDNWPEWHYGVLLLYGGHIAINHCTAAIDVVKNRFMLDYDVQHSCDETIYDHAHMHCWHGDSRFSKFAFRRGEYNNLTIADLNINKTCDYATYIALITQPGYNRYLHRKTKAVLSDFKNQKVVVPEHVQEKLLTNLDANSLSSLTKLSQYLMTQLTNKNEVL